jgi:hypothetical protein
MSAPDPAPDSLRAAAKQTIKQRLQQQAAKYADCPGSRLATELETVFKREKGVAAVVTSSRCGCAETRLVSLRLRGRADEGAFDESLVRAAFVAFVVLVFARVDDFVVVTGDMVTMDRDKFRATYVKQPRISRLLEEMRESQMPEEFATSEYRRRRSSTPELRNDASGIIDMALKEMLPKDKGLGPAVTFGSIMRIVLRVIQPDTTPPSPLLVSIKETKTPSDQLSMPELRVHLESLTASTVRTPLGFRSEDNFRASVRSVGRQPRLCLHDCV